MTERLQFHFSLSCAGEGNGNPLQCSCLENPRDGGAWGAAVYGVAQCQTRLKRLSSSTSPSNRLDTFQPGGGTSSSGVKSFCLFIQSMSFFRQEYGSGLPFPSPLDHVLSELFTMTSVLGCQAWYGL